MALKDWFKNNVDNNIGIFKDISLQQQALDPNTLMGIVHGDDTRKDIVNSMLNEEVKQRNFINDAINQGMVNQIHNRDIEGVIEVQKQKEILHQRNMAEIRAVAENMREQQRQINNQEELMKRRDVLAESIRLRDLQMKKELNQTKNRESFNFYKVAELLRKKATLREAMTGAGCIKNAKYQLDYDGRAFIVIDDEHIDSCCSHAKQNMAFEGLDKNNKLVIVTGFDNRTNYSAGMLLYKPEFGVILFKKDRYVDEYPTKLGKMLKRKKMMNCGNRFDTIALSKTFAKIPFITAVCVNVDRGIESPLDREELEMNCKIDPNIIHTFRGICGDLGVKP